MPTPSRFCQDADPGAFYDGLAEHYHLIFPDWKKAIQRQSGRLDDILVKAFGRIERIHDASAGIGTQILGLASRGYRVSASDLSAKAIERLRLEANQSGISCPASVQDMRHVDVATTGRVEVVISLDNSLPHLLNDEDIVAALTALRCIATRGVVVSLRDYDLIDPTVRHQHIYAPREDHGDLVTFFQLWDFTPGTRIYNVRMYMVRDQIETGVVNTQCWKTRYYAITTTRLAELFQAAGFSRAEILRDAFYQPVIVGYING